MRQKGFTLIELMIVVIVIAILAAVALPSYREYTFKGRRADAVAAVGDLRLKLERWRVENPSFANNCGANCNGSYPVNPSSLYYEVKVTAADASSYTITAKPIGNQSKDRCGNLEVTQDKKPTWKGDANCN